MQPMRTDLEVPFDALEAEHASFLTLEELVHRMLVVAIHLDLRHDGKRHTIIQRTEALNLSLRTGLLTGSHNTTRHRATDGNELSRRLCRHPPSRATRVRVERTIRSRCTGSRG
jgi:hypothetical protein